MHPPRALPSNDTHAEDWLVGGGEMGKLLRSMDWSKTPLGPIESWPQSLRTTVSLCLASNFPISLAWGPRHVQIYNDGYWPICGGKHPHSMGQDFSECWASAWPVIGEAFGRALAGETSYLENQRMFLDRNGYLEETFFTFSFSPIRDESGGVGGLFHPVTETTAKMLGGRRTRALRDLAANAGEAKTSAEALAACAKTLSGCELDIPFALLYLLEPAASQATLIASCGLEIGTLASPERITLGAEMETTWPLARVARTGKAELLRDVEQRLGALACGPYPERPKLALLLPITPAGRDQAAAVLVAGVSSRLPLTEIYRAFYDLVASAITNGLSNARAYEEERRRAEALAELDRAKTAFFSNVSHEFRTPLTLMLGPLEDELAERGEALPAPRRERLETAYRNTLRLLKLVNTLLDFSRIEAGRIHACYEATDLAAYTADLASIFRSAVEKAGLTLRVACPALPEPVFVDRDMWEKIVLNLLSNALKHTFEGSITVSLCAQADVIELAVTDTGVGIPEAELPRVFERFHRVKGAKSRTHEGTGIGLALIQELSALHGGSVRVASRSGHGTTFTVAIKTGREHLPQERIGTGAGATLGSQNGTSAAAAYVQEALHWLSDGRGSLPPSAELVYDAESHDAHSGPRRRERIIWADDNADMRDYVRRLLGGRYDVIAVADGSAALAAARETPPDLVLSDVMMPELDGFGLLRALRNEPTTHTVPVILLSARAGEEASVEGIEAGADDYLVKPFSARELLARVHTHLKLARARRQWELALEQSNKELEAFSYSVSHDLRAPLRAIDGFTRALISHQGAQLDAKSNGYLERVRAATARMSCLIDDLLSLSRITRSAMERERVDLSKIARQLGGELELREPERQVELQIEDGLIAEGDARFITVALENLLGNAWKFTQRKNQAQIQVGRLANDCEHVYFVRDDGAGFDMTYANRLFQPFQRLHSPSEFEGTGIGLAIVQRIVSRHGGRIWVEATPNQGATFYFTLVGAS